MAKVLQSMLESFIKISEVFRDAIDNHQLLIFLEGMIIDRLDQV